MVLPRFLAAARLDDPERTVKLANDLHGADTPRGPVALLQCGSASASASACADALRRAGRNSLSVVVRDRETAQSDMTLRRMAAASAVWVFAEDLLEAFLCVFATQLAFSVRARAQQGLPVIGIGNGAMALGGLVIARRVAQSGQHELVSGLGWAPRVLFDGGESRHSHDGAVALEAVRSLPGLTGVDLGIGGGLRVVGGQAESVGLEPVSLYGLGHDGNLLTMALEPGQAATLAPLPFAPVRPRATTPWTSTPAPRTQPPVPSAASIASAAGAGGEVGHAAPGSGRVCPMCRKIHLAQTSIELAA